MLVLPLYIEFEQQRPTFEPCLNHRDLLSGLVLPVILAAQRKRWHELQNRDSTSAKKADTNESRSKPHNDVSADEKLSQKPKEKNIAHVKSDADNFEISLDVQHFSPEELSVKTADGCIVVEGKHEEKQDEHGYISRQFVRRYALPEGCYSDTVESKLSSDRMLTVTAPKKRSTLTTERAVPIAHTGPLHDSPSTSQQQQDHVRQ